MDADKKTSSQNVPEPIRKAMQQTNELFNTEVVKKGNFDALDRIYTTNARVLPPGADLTRGRDQIKEFWRHAIPGLGVKEARLTTTETEKNGNGILEIGTVQLTLTGDKIVTSKYVVYWVKENGTWKWDVDTWNQNQ
jgi:ketosteroid isomerase-like protein